ncbi:myeloid cell surface antigen CD33-like [Tenrec ecaudatus]|uniref:myeloid cell surface antigen CD33-like n=1 Tax=Tenrec ecaudatus TaxID=94439 RepID=UPI003F594356
MFLLLLLLLLPLSLLGQGFWVPDPRFNLQISKTVTVQQGLCVSVPCVVSYPQRDWNQSTPSLGYWFRDGSNTDTDPPVATNDPQKTAREETRDRFHLTGDPQRNSCSLDITDARRTDLGLYFFRIVRGTYVKYNYKYNQVYVNVTALTETPKIHIQGTLEAGHPRNITCNTAWACRRGTPPIFSWIGVTVTSLGPMDPHSSILTFTPEPAHNSTNLTCRVTFPGANVTTESTIQLIVSSVPALKEEQELHYASVTFQEPQSRSSEHVKEQEFHYASVPFQKPQSRSSEHIKEQETPSTTEYSEIRLAK